MHSHRSIFFNIPPMFQRKEMKTRRSPSQPSAEMQNAQSISKVVKPKVAYKSPAQPQNNFVKREEFVKMLVMAADIYNPDAKCTLNDVETGKLGNIARVIEGDIPANRNDIVTVIRDGKKVAIEIDDDEIALTEEEGEASKSDFTEFELTSKKLTIDLGDEMFGELEFKRVK